MLATRNTSTTMKVMTILRSNTWVPLAVRGAVGTLKAEVRAWRREVSLHGESPLKPSLALVDVSGLGTGGRVSSGPDDYDCIRAQDLFNSQPFSPSIPATLPAEGMMRKKNHLFAQSARVVRAQSGLGEGLVWC